LGGTPTEGHALPGTEPITTSITVEDGIAVVAVSGEVDLSTVPAFEAAIDDALTRGPGALVIDLSGVDFLASAGLQTLVATHERIGKDVGFAVVADGAATSRPIQLTGLDQVLSLYPTIDEARADLHGTG
jgi:anti-anti-sigma factor